MGFSVAVCSSPVTWDDMQCCFSEPPSCPAFPLEHPLEVKGPASLGEPRLKGRGPKKATAGITTGQAEKCLNTKMNGAEGSGRTWHGV